jgi:hypothetical protein
MSRALQHHGQRIKRSLRRSGEAGEASGTVVKLDGKLPSVTKEIRRLHGEILSAFKVSVPKAIRVGELLDHIRKSRRVSG